MCIRDSIDNARSDFFRKLKSNRPRQERDLYEYELQMDVLGRMIRTVRLERKITQEQLGKFIGVQKSQISKLESSTNSATIDTIIKVFKALKAEIHFNIKLEKEYLQIAI